MEELWRRKHWSETKPPWEEEHWRQSCQRANVPLADVDPGTSREPLPPAARLDQWSNELCPLGCDTKPHPVTFRPFASFQMLSASPYFSFHRDRAGRSATKRFLHEKGVKAAFSPARPSFFAISKLGPGHPERIGCERLRDGLLSLPSADHLKNKGVFPSSQAVPRSLFNSVRHPGELCMDTRAAPSVSSWTRKLFHVWFTGQRMNRRHSWVPAHSCESP